MVYRIAWFFFVCCGCYGVAEAQEPTCSSMAAKVEDMHTTGSTPGWRIYVENRSNDSVRVSVPESGFQWKIEEPIKDGSHVILSGGTGPGRASAGSTPKLSGSIQVLAPGRKLPAARFDLRHDTEAGNDLLENHEYGITFEFEVAISRNGRQSVACHLATDAQRFLFTRAARHPGS